MMTRPKCGCCRLPVCCSRILRAGVMMDFSVCLPQQSSSSWESNVFMTMASSWPGQKLCFFVASHLIYCMSAREFMLRSGSLALCTAWSLLSHCPGSIECTSAGLTAQHTKSRFVHASGKYSASFPHAAASTANVPGLV